MNRENPPQKTWLAILLLITAMVSIQGGASLSKTLFPTIGAEGVTALRLGISSILLMIYFRPWRHKREPSAQSNVKALLIYGLSLGSMNYCFYLAIKTIPLGIAVALEFTGPLAVALFSSRKLIDFVWVGFAIVGIALILPLGENIGDVNMLGAMFALIAGVCWAIYILAGKRAGSTYGTGSVAIGTLIAAITFTPLGIIQSSGFIFTPEILLVGFFIALLASAIPYSLEMYSMTKLPPKTFGTLLSLEPAIATISGILFLGEYLTLAQWIGLLAIVIASAGATLTLRRRH